MYKKIIIVNNYNKQKKELEKMNELDLALIEMKEKIFNGEEIQFDELTKKYDVKKEFLLPYKQLLKAFKKASEEDRAVYNMKPVWSDAENYIVALYVHDTEKYKTKSKALKEVSQILGRTKDSVEFRYYTHIRNEIDISEIVREYSSDNSNDKEEIIQEIKQETSIEQKIENEIKEENIISIPPKIEEKEDLLDYVESIFKNVKKLPNLDMTSLFKGLSILTEAAVKNNLDPEVVTTLKNESERKEQKISELEKQIQDMNDEYNHIRHLIQLFNELDSSEKLSQIKTFSNSLKSVLEE
jgi:hypothetical protein